MSKNKNDLGLKNLYDAFYKEIWYTEVTRKMKYQKQDMFLKLERFIRETSHTK